VRVDEPVKVKKKPGQIVPSIVVYVTPRPATDAVSDARRDVYDTESIATNLVSKHLVFSVRMD
jgi:hypothetical protein